MFTMDFKYGKDQFNYIYRIANYFKETVPDENVKEIIANYIEDITKNNSWIMEDGSMNIILKMTQFDISVHMYIFENILLYTAEAQRIMAVCDDKFSELLKKAEKGKINE